MEGGAFCLAGFEVVGRFLAVVRCEGISANFSIKVLLSVENDKAFTGHTVLQRIAVAQHQESKHHQAFRQRPHRFFPGFRRQSTKGPAAKYRVKFIKRPLFGKIMLREYHVLAQGNIKPGHLTAAATVTLKRGPASASLCS